MEEIIKQIKIGLDHNLYFLCLYTTLTLPDICGAVESINGEASGLKYREWYDKYVIPHYKALTSTDCYGFRCKLLHQAQTQSQSSNFTFLAFAEPTQGFVWRGQLFLENQPNLLSIDVIEFITAIINGVENWMVEKKETESFKTNITKCITRHDGLFNIVAGVPYIY